MHRQSASWKRIVCAAIIKVARQKAARLKHAPWKAGFKPVFHGACFEADSAPTLSAPYTRQARP